MYLYMGDDLGFPGLTGSPFIFSWLRFPCLHFSSTLTRIFLHFLLRRFNRCRPLCFFSSRSVLTGFLTRVSLCNWSLLNLNLLWGTGLLFLDFLDLSFFGGRFIYDYLLFLCLLLNMFLFRIISWSFPLGNDLSLTTKSFLFHGLSFFSALFNRFLRDLTAASLFVSFWYWGFYLLLAFGGTLCLDLRSCCSTSTWLLSWTLFWG